MNHVSRRQFVQLAAGAAAIPRAFVVQSNQPQADAMAAVKAAIPVAAADPERPVYHFRPPANWTNDPNGTIYYKGWHHLFYQLNPTAPRAGNQHWGHARSRDLVNWEHLPIALWPSTDRGERAIFSGGAIAAPDGKVRLFYTSIGHPTPQQWMAVPLDDELIAWEKPSFNPILTLAAHGAVEVSQWRDPFLFREGGRTYMVLGGNLNNSRGGGGVTLLYRAATEDMTRWEYLGVLHRYHDRQMWNVECPNFFKLGNKWVLIVSPQQACEYFIGELDLPKARFIPEAHGVLDAGSAYASNISVDDRARTILWLWGRTNTAPEKGWNGVMVMPRMLSIGSDGLLRQIPAPEFEALRDQPVAVTDREIPTTRCRRGGSGRDSHPIQRQRKQPWRETSHRQLTCRFICQVVVAHRRPSLRRARGLQLRAIAEAHVIPIFAKKVTMQHSSYMALFAAKWSLTRWPNLP